MKQPIKRRICAAKSAALFEQYRIVKASLPDSLQIEPCIAAVSCDEDLVKKLLKDIILKSLQYNGGYEMFWYDATYVILIPAIIFTFIAQGKVTSNFNKFSKVRTRRGMTGAEAARLMLDANGLRDVDIEMVRGSLTDHYDPRSRVLRLSESVCNVTSVAAVSVACHEAGHAVQHAEGYTPLQVRNSIVPVVNFASSLSWPVAILGIILLGNGSYIGNTLFNIGIIAMLAVIFFHTITLPVEYNASRRAKDQMEELGIVSGSEEAAGARKVLNAAAMTYVAALATAIANLLRILAIRGRREN